jgi:hypothetical protein
MFRYLQEIDQSLLFESVFFFELSVELFVSILVGFSPALEDPPRDSPEWDVAFEAVDLDA